MEGVSREVAGPALVRKINARQVLDALRLHGAMSTNELVEATGMSRPTVHAVAAHLMSLGWAAEVAAPGTKVGRGRPSRAFSFRKSAGHVLGVDIGAHTVRATIANLAGEDVASAERTFDDPDMSADDRIARVREFLTEVLAGAGLTPARIMTVCVGSSGPISPEGVVRLRTGIPGFLDLDLRGAIATGFGWDVVVENDCNLAAVGEQWRGLAVGKKDFVCLLAGERLGAGIVVDGRLVRGHHHSAGGVLFLQLMRDPSAGEGIAYLARSLGAEALADAPGDSALYKLTEGDAARIDAATVIRAAAEGDGVAARVLDRAVGPAAAAIATMGMLLDPELVILSGAVASAGDGLLEPVRRGLAALGSAMPSLAASPLGHNAVVTGAVRLALDRAESRHLAELRAAPVSLTT